MQNKNSKRLWCNIRRIAIVISATLTLQMHFSRNKFLNYKIFYFSLRGTIKKELINFSWCLYVARYNNTRNKKSTERWINISRIVTDIVNRLRNIHNFRRQIACSIDTTLIQNRLTLLWFPSDEFDCYEAAYEIHSASRRLSRAESERVCTARSGNDRHRRNRTEREKVKRGREWKKPTRGSAVSETRESMKAGGFVREGVEGEEARGAGTGSSGCGYCSRPGSILP